MSNKLVMKKRKINGVERNFVDPRMLKPNPLNKKIYNNKSEEEKTQQELCASFIQRKNDGLCPNEQPVMIYKDGMIDAGHTRREAAILADVELWFEYTDKPRPDLDKPYTSIKSVTESNIYRKMTPSVKLNEYQLSEKSYMEEFGMARPDKLRKEHIKQLGTSKRTLNQLIEIKRLRPELLKKIDNQEMSVKSAHDEATGKNVTKVIKSNNVNRDWSEIYTDDVFSLMMNRVYNTIQTTLNTPTMICGEEYFPYKDFTDGTISTMISHLTEMIGSKVLMSEGHDVQPATGHPTDPDIRHLDIDDKVEIKVTKFNGTQTKWKSGRGIREGQYILITYNEDLNMFGVVFTKLLQEDFTKSGSGIMSGHTIDIKNVYQNHKDDYRVVYGQVFENDGKVILQLEDINK